MHIFNLTAAWRSNYRDALSFTKICWVNQFSMVLKTDLTINIPTISQLTTNLTFYLH